MATNKKQQQSPSIIKAAVQGVVRGAASGGGLISTPFRAMQTGVGTVKNISRGMKQYNNSQQPAKPKPAAKPVKPAKPAPAKPMKTAPKPNTVKKPVMKKK